MPYAAIETATNENSRGDANKTDWYSGIPIINEIKTGRVSSRPMIQEWILLAWYKIIEKKKKEDKKSYEETRNEGRSEKKKREWRIVQEKAEIEKLEWIFLDVIRSDVVNYWIFFLTNLVTHI